MRSPSIAGRCRIGWCPFQINYPRPFAFDASSLLTIQAPVDYVAFITLLLYAPKIAAGGAPLCAGDVLKTSTPVYRYSRSGVAALRPILYRCLQELLVKSITPGPPLRLVVTTCSLRVVLSIYDLRVNLFDCRKRKLDVYLGVCYVAISHLR
jgi:hypothetical protein